MATAYTQIAKAGYHYQYSVPFAFHASDIAVYFGPVPENVGPDFALAFRRAFPHLPRPSFHPGLADIEIKVSGATSS